MLKPANMHELLNSEYFCAYPFLHLSTVPAGFLRPCCFYQEMIKNDDGTTSNISTNTIEQIWNNNNFRNIRKSMLNNEKLTGCGQCQREDAHGGDSMRKRSLREWGNRSEFGLMVEDALENDGKLKSDIKFLELKPGNLCNLKCRMCNQFDSSSYAAELQTIGAKFSGIENTGSRLFEDHTFEFDFNLSKMADWKNNTAVWDSFERLIPSLENLSFAGGEPTLIEEVYQALKKCVDTGHSRHITVYFASNFTQKMEKFLALSKHFRRFDFIASIDGTEEVQEYIRFPSKWSVVSDNFKQVAEFCRFQKNVNALVNMTVNVYNISGVTRLLSWIEQDSLKESFKEDPYNLNILVYPQYLAIANLPDTMKESVVAELEAFGKRSWAAKRTEHIAGRFVQLTNMVKASKIENHLKTLKEFWVYNAILDQHRKQSFQHALPELHTHVVDCLHGHGIDPEGLLKFYKVIT